jgi:hypothetical protein
MLATGIPPSMEAKALDARLAEVESEIRSLDIEWLIALRVDGTEAIRKSGSRNEVPLVQADVTAMTGCVVTHNHPDGKSFSEKDIALACGASVLEIRVVTPTWTFRMRPPPGGWSLITWLETIEPVFDYTYWDIKAEMERAIKGGGMQDLDHDWEFWSELWQQVAAKCSLQYDEEPVHEAE